MAIPVLNTALQQREFSMQYRPYQLQLCSAIDVYRKRFMPDVETSSLELSARSDVYLEGIQRQIHQREKVFLVALSKKLTSRLSHANTITDRTSDEIPER